MKLYKYEATEETLILTSSIEVKENKSSYSLISNPQKRIPKDKVGKCVITNDETYLYLTSPDRTQALLIYAGHLVDQAGAYNHITKVLLNKAEKIGKEINVRL